MTERRGSRTSRSPTGRPVAWWGGLAALAALAACAPTGGAVLHGAPSTPAGSVASAIAPTRARATAADAADAADADEIPAERIAWDTARTMRGTATRAPTGGLDGVVTTRRRDDRDDHDAARAPSSPSARVAPLRGTADDCADRHRNALVAGGESVERRLALAACEGERGRLLEALSDATHAFDVATHGGDARGSARARAALDQLDRRVPHVAFVARRGASAIASAHVTFDGAAVDGPLLERRFAVDPGRHHVVAHVVVAGRAQTLDRDLDVAEQMIVELDLTANDVGGPVAVDLPGERF